MKSKTLSEKLYDDFLIGSVAASSHPDFELLWQALFTRNEMEYGRHYPHLLRALLQALSADFHPQTTLLSGHMDCQGGYTLVTRQHLRLAIAKNAHPRQAGLYVLFDMEGKVETAEDLLAGLGTVFK